MLKVASSATVFLVEWCLVLPREFLLSRAGVKGEANDAGPLLHRVLRVSQIRLTLRHLL